MPSSTLRRRSIRLPGEVVLNARSLAAIAARFPADELGDLIERLIDRLDAMTPAADLEPDPEMCRV